MMRLRARLHRLRQDGERGATIVVVAVVLTALLASGAIAIDLSAARAQQQQAQTAADAAALAAADSIPAGNSSQSVSAVSQTATAIATANLPGSTVAVSMPSASSASVTVSSASGNTLAGLFGSGSTRVSASATASQGSSTGTTGTNATGADVAIFANNDSCTAGTGLSIGGSLLGLGVLSGLLPANSLNIDASTVVSNGLETIKTSNFPSNGSTFVYGGRNGCGYSGSTVTSSTFTKSTADYSYPISYTQSQVPSACTSISSTLTIGSSGLSGGTYCSSTALTITVVGSNLQLSGVSFIAPSITINSVLGSIQSWTPAGNAPGGNLLAWAQTGDLALNLTGANNQLSPITGVLYAPTSGTVITINTSAINSSPIISGGSPVCSVAGGGTLIEGDSVQIATQTMNLNGCGPATSTGSTTTTTTGQANLTQ